MKKKCSLDPIPTRITVISISSKYAKVETVAGTARIPLLKGKRKLKMRTRPILIK